MRKITDQLENVGQADGVTKTQAVTAVQRNKKLLIGIAVVAIAVIVFVLTR